MVAEVPGLYFMGLLFQFGFTSMLIGGAEREAKHVADHILKAAARQPAAEPTAVPLASPILKYVAALARFP